MLYNISASLLVNYMSFQGKTKLTLDEMFKRLSLELGGDGKTITKKQLNDYIAKADSGQLDVGKSKLKALKNIQKNWDDLFAGKDSITVSDMEKCPVLLMNVFTGDIDKIETPEKKSSDDENELYEYLKSNLNIDEEKVTKDGLSKYLQSLIAESSEENDNANDIGLITNLIANFETISNGDDEISIKSLLSTNDFEA